MIGFGAGEPVMAGDGTTKNRSRWNLEVDSVEPSGNVWNEYWKRLVNCDAWNPKVQEKFLNVSIF